MDMSAQSLDIVASLAGNKIAVLAPQILVVEDETHLRDLLDEALTENGLRIVTAADGIEGMAVLESHPGIELVLSDVRMPRMNGYEFVEKALGMRPELKVLMMTPMRLRCHPLRSCARAKLGH